MTALTLILLSWMLLFSFIFVIVIEIVLIVWAIAEIRSRLQHLKLQKIYREHEFELFANRHMRLWRHTQKRETFTRKLNGR